jgi:hypothetical protein
MQEALFRMLCCLLFGRKKDIIIPLRARKGMHIILFIDSDVLSFWPLHILRIIASHELTGLNSSIWSWSDWWKMQLHASFWVFPYIVQRYLLSHIFLLSWWLRDNKTECGSSFDPSSTRPQLTKRPTAQGNSMNFTKTKGKILLFGY